MIIKNDNLLINIFAESGHMAYNVVNKFYFEAFTDYNKTDFAEFDNAKIFRKLKNN